MALGRLPHHGLRLCMGWWSVFYTNYGSEDHDAKNWYRLDAADARDEDGWPTDKPAGKCVFPDMKARKRVTLGKRSGIMIFGIRKK